MATNNKPDTTTEPDSTTKMIQALTQTLTNAPATMTKKQFDDLAKHVTGSLSIIKQRRIYRPETNTR